MGHRRYQHIERLENEEVIGLLDGECYIFPKLDGTNAQIWLNQETSNIHAGSRRRDLVGQKDNFDFYTGFLLTRNYEKFKKFFESYPNCRLYGEYLVPHTLKTYRGEAWNRFYIFDVWADDHYMHYETYKPVLEEFKLDFIPAIAIVVCPTEEQLIKMLDNNTYLIQDGVGVGEGIVIKRYDFVNQFGRTVWGKIVRAKFKEQNIAVWGTKVWGGSKDPVEYQIADMFVTEGRVNKVLENMKASGGWSSKRIPELFQRVFYDVVTEETWNILKKFKDPKIDFRRLRGAVIAKIKVVRGDLF